MLLCLIRQSVAATPQQSCLDPLSMHAGVPEDECGSEADDAVESGGDLDAEWAERQNGHAAAQASGLAEVGSREVEEEAAAEGREDDGEGLYEYHFLEDGEGDDGEEGDEEDGIEVEDDDGATGNGASDAFLRRRTAWADSKRNGGDSGSTRPDLGDASEVQSATAPDMRFRSVCKPLVWMVSSHLCILRNPHNSRSCFGLSRPEQIACNLLQAAFDYCFSEDEEEPVPPSRTCQLEHCIMWGGEQRLRIQVLLETQGRGNRGLLASGSSACIMVYC